MITIDGVVVKANKGDTILKTALEQGIYIPHLCYHPDLKPFGGCRLCTVEVEGRGLTISCKTPIKEGMVVRTESPEISKVRRIATQMLILNHYADCLQCVKSTECKLLSLTAYIGIDQRLKRVTSTLSIDDSNPFFLRDPNKCVLCGICVRTCQEIQGVGAIDLAFREYWKQWKKYQQGSLSSTDLIAQGDKIKIAAFNKPIIESKCESCGECVVRCPTGALVAKNRLKPSYEVKTICPYCGCGCGIYLGARGNLIVNVRGDPDSPVNKGNLCVKGRYGYNFINHPERLTTPLIKRNGNFVKASWEEALNLVASRLANYKGEQFAIMGSGKITNEEIYLIQKFARAVMGTNQAESPARLCHLPTIIGLTESTGSSSMPFPIEQLSEAGCIIVAGANTTETHPIIGLEIKRAVKRGVKLLVIDPRWTELAAMADVHLNLWPGTDVALIMGMCRVILEENRHAQDFINQRTENFASFKEAVQNFPLDFVEQVTRIAKEKIVDGARIVATFTPGAYLYAMGTTQHTHGTDNVQALVNLALLTGSYGKLGGGVAPLRGHNNIHGATAFGAVTHLLPGYQYVTNPEHRKKFEKAWNCKINPEPGLTALEWVTHRGKVKAIYIVGNNPLRSWADINQTQKAFEQLEFLVVQDIFLTETAQMADVVLPAVSFAEK
ncbi:molybdopterin-dependent oxidoreductase, partial [Dehalococcoidales bacterium]|nr:molybdopterin-dependent oxidoreductase [Dehalococcoidales bacterium]